MKRAFLVPDGFVFPLRLQGLAGQRMGSAWVGSTGGRGGGVPWSSFLLLIYWALWLGWGEGEVTEQMPAKGE